MKGLFLLLFMVVSVELEIKFYFEIFDSLLLRCVMCWIFYFVVMVGFFFEEEFFWGRKKKVVVNRSGNLNINSFIVVDFNQVIVDLIYDLFYFNCFCFVQSDG